MKTAGPERSHWALLSLLALFLAAGPASGQAVNPAGFTPGMYAGLVSAPTVTTTGSGYLTVKLTATGSFTGALHLGAYNFTFKNTFDGNGNFVGNLVTPNGKSYFHLVMSASMGAGAGATIGGEATLQVANPIPTNPSPGPQMTFTLELDSAAGVTSPYEGLYTVKFPPPSAASSVPQGYGYGAIHVFATGVTKIVGGLGDSLAISASTYINPDGTLPVFVRPYSVKAPGIFIGVLSLGSASTTGTFVGPITWIKLRRPDDRYYSGGFSVTVNALGSAYVPPATNGTPISVPNVPTSTGSLTNVTLTYNGGGIYRSHQEQGQLLGMPAAGPYEINMLATNSTHSAYLLHPNGLFTGSYYDPLSRKRRPLAGVFVQGDNTGAGGFIGPYLIGSVLITADAVK
jgi:hypothetical protein